MCARVIEQMEQSKGTMQMMIKEQKDWIEKLNTLINSNNRENKDRPPYKTMTEENNNDKK